MYKLKFIQENIYKLMKYVVYVTLLLIIFYTWYLKKSLIPFWTDVELLPVFSRITVQSEDIKKSNLNIFFIETSCCVITDRQKFRFENYFGMTLNIRQACAIESTAYLNRDYTIYVLYSCPFNENIFKKTSEVIKQMFQYTNIKIVKLDMNKYFRDTPVEDLFVKGVLKQTNYAYEHIGYILRFLTLWKYGGSYLDLDIMSIRSINELGSNFAAYETKTDIGSTVLNFESQGFGYILLTQILQQLNKYSDGNLRPKNISKLLTETIFNLCIKRQKTEENDKILCGGFTIYQSKIFHPLPWNQWKMYFQENSSKVTLQQVNNSFIVHFWNKFSHETSVNVGSKQPYEVLADQYCKLTHNLIENLHYYSY